MAPGGSHPTDVRMTTRFKEEDLTEGLTGAIHETGQHNCVAPHTTHGVWWWTPPVTRR